MSGKILTAFGQSPHLQNEDNNTVEFHKVALHKITLKYTSSLAHSGYSPDRSPFPFSDSSS